jgi:hypothetical protein
MRGKKKLTRSRLKALKQRIHPEIFIIIHISLRLKKCAIGDVMIQKDVKPIRILGRFLAKKKDVMRIQDPNMTIAIHMQKNIDQRNIIIRKSLQNSRIYPSKLF